MNINEIQDGYVIDHIHAGRAMRIYRYLELDQLDCSVAIIKNAKSDRMGRKDIIKIDELIPLNLEVISSIDSGATVNTIQNGELVHKQRLTVPERVQNVLKCKNPRCVTQTEPEIPHVFVLADREKLTYAAITAIHFTSPRTDHGRYAVKTRFIRSFLAFCLLAAVMLSAAAGFGTDAIPAASGELPGVLRILLTRLEITTQADIQIDGTYTMDVGGITLLFPHGSEITVLLIGDRLYIDYEGMRLGSAASLTLTRCQDDSGEENGLRFYGSSSLYEGDLSLTVSEGVIRPILSIAVEDYLLGVVPYEMSDSFPLEALKAQTIAARTYAVRKARMNASADYDLADTTNDQVFRAGILITTAPRKPCGRPRACARFITEASPCATTAPSNGGQTELVENQWGAGDETGYLDMRDDPYDLENVKSVVKSVILPKTAYDVEQTPYGLRALIAENLKEALEEQGYDPAGESLRIDTISAVSVDTPKFAAPSRLYTMFHITFTYSARTRTDPVIITSHVLTSALTDEVEVSLFTATPAQATETPAPSETPLPTATPTPVYGAFEPVEGEVSLSFPIFPDAEQALSLSINLYENELWTVTEYTDSFIVESRRFGHGVGMSQYGAEQMASRYSMSYTDILSFYYPGVTLMRYPDVVTSLPSVSTVFTQEADPPPSPRRAPR